MALKTLTDKRYYGKVCARHPEFEGLRLKRANKCVQCQSEDQRCVPRGTLSVGNELDHRIHILKKKWDGLNTAMQEVHQQLGVLIAEKEALDEASKGE